MKRFIEGESRNQITLMPACLDDYIDADNPVRRVLRSEIESVEPLLSYTIEATAFLRHMVRNIIGTLVEIGDGQRPVDDVERLLAARDRTLAGPTVPPCGLCLQQVKY